MEEERKREIESSKEREIERGREQGYFERETVGGGGEVISYPVVLASQ